MYLHSEKYPDFEVIARRVFGRSSPLLGDIFGIWISDFRVLDFEEGGAAELGGGALGRRLRWDSKSSLHLVSWRSEPFGGTLQEWFDEIEWAATLGRGGEWTG